MENQQPQNQQNQIQIKITDEVLKGVYSNMAQVSHSPEEFVLDFMNISAGMGSVNARVIVSPGHFKRLIAAMEDNLKAFEKQFGNIKPSEGPNQKIGFRTE